MFSSLPTDAVIRVPFTQGRGAMALTGCSSETCLLKVTRDANNSELSRNYEEV